MVHRMFILKNSCWEIETGLRTPPKKVEIHVQKSQVVKCLGYCSKEWIHVVKESETSQKKGSGYSVLKRIYVVKVWKNWRPKKCLNVFPSQVDPEDLAPGASPTTPSVLTTPATPTAPAATPAVVLPSSLMEATSAAAAPSAPATTMPAAPATSIVSREELLRAAFKRKSPEELAGLIAEAKAKPEFQIFKTIEKIKIEKWATFDPIEELVCFYDWLSYAMPATQVAPPATPVAPAVPAPPTASVPATALTAAPATVAALGPSGSSCTFVPQLPLWPQWLQLHLWPQ